MPNSQEHDDHIDEQANPAEPTESANAQDDVLISSPDPLPDNDEPTPTVVLSKQNVIQEQNPDISENDAVMAKEKAKGRETQSVKWKEDVEVNEGENGEPRQIKISCHRCGQKLDLTHMEPFSIVECPSCTENIIVPKWFDHYLLEEPGGIGGMATVYRALDLSLDREVAIKVLNPELAIKKEKSDLFLNEARTAATINHFGVIPVFTCGEFNGQPYIVMQYMEGGSLEDKMKMERELQPINDVCNWIKDVSEGLDNARRHGIIHHDVKPGNIMLDDDGNAKVGDFGIAQAIHDDRTDQLYEMTKSWLSPHYVSPEKVATGREDFLGDIYSLGATFYHLLTGKTPFDNDDVQQLIRARLVTSPIDPKEIRPEIPVKLSNLVMSMMDREIDNRPNYKDVVKAIKHCQKELEQGAVKSKTSPAKTQKKVIKQKPAAGGISKSRLDSAFNKNIKKKNPILSWLYYVVICSILAVCIVYLYKSGKGEKIINRMMGKAAVDNKPQMPQDLASDVTWAFSQGDSTQAEKLSQEIYENAMADLEKRSQAALQNALAKYLNGSETASDDCFTIAERLLASGVSENDDNLSIIFYLANREIGADALRERLSVNPYYQVLGELAILLRAIHEKQPDLELDSLYYKFDSRSNKTPKEFWGNAWHNRLSKWSRSLKLKRGNKEELEPIFASMILTHEDAPAKKLDSIEQSSRIQKVDDDEDDDRDDHFQVKGFTFDAYRAAQEKLGKRPYTGANDLDYDKDKIQHYIDGLQDKVTKRREAEKYEYVKDSKDYLTKLFARSEYLGPVKTKNRYIKDGQISLANINGFFFKKRGGSKSYNCKWKDVPFEQYINIFKYFASERLKIEGPNMSEDERKKLAADEYFHLAVLCDWHGDYRNAFKYAKKSIQVYPPTKEKVNRILMGN